MDETLIIGAGPTGLAAALFLAKRSCGVRIVDARTERSERSKALVVNARTLELLAHTGVAATMVEAGRRVDGVDVWAGARRVAQLELTSAQAPERHVAILPQTDSERLLEAALADAGVHVERGVELVELAVEAGRARFALRHPDGGVERGDAPALLGCDGSRSAVRAALGIGFVGAEMPGTFSLADVRADTDLDGDRINTFVHADGGLLAVRLRDDAWRLASASPGLLDRLPAAIRPREVLWRSEYRVAHRTATRMLHGPVALAGDAAHVHSPFGGRGMNLGIEDAFVLATLVAEGRLEAYDRLRRPVDLRVTNRVRRMTTAVRSTSPPARAARTASPHAARLAVRVLGPTLRTWVLGLDHPVAVA
ncbi:MAG: hypothetical protein JWM98_324 [Thermoleophilia bacterium]|nr:hypothetical protein [Thermoleophilia bacterium]